MGQTGRFNSPISLKLAGVIYDAPAVYVRVICVPAVYQALSFQHALTGSSPVRLVTQLGVGGIREGFLKEEI